MVSEATVHTGRPAGRGMASKPPRQVTRRPHPQRRSGRARYGEEAARPLTRHPLASEPDDRTLTPLVQPTIPRVDSRNPVSIDLPFVTAYRVDPWSALGDPTRKAIFELLADRPRPVGELANELPVSRPAVSQHLKVLKDAGLVLDQSFGTRRVYRVDPDGLASLRADLDRFWGKTLLAYKAAVEQPTKEEA